MTHPLVLMSFLGVAACRGAAAVPATSPPPQPAPQDASCGALDCHLLDAPESALKEILDRRPLVIGVGEGHAQKGTEKIASVTKRFTESFLPLLEGRASDLVVELWMPDPKCAEKVETVREQQKPVTEEQAKTNKSEFEILAEKARAHGIVPWPLRPTCDEYAVISRTTGDDAIAKMLELTATMAARTVERCLERNAKRGVEKIVVAYGGAMHNDVVPQPGREAWTFGPKMVALTGGRYAELDLFVPESIRDTESWRLLPWHAHFERASPHPKATCYRPDSRSWALVFPTSGP